MAQGLCKLASDSLDYIAKQNKVGPIVVGVFWKFYPAHMLIKLTLNALIRDREAQFLRGGDKCGGRHSEAQYENTCYLSRHWKL